MFVHKTEEREALILNNAGEKIFAVIHRPLTKSKVPGIVICSGFAGNKCGKYRLYVRLSQELAKRGIAVIRFDYRGVGDSEGDFQDITLEGKVSDTLVCLDFLQNDPQINPERIGLMGRSLGGVIAILTARRYGKIKSLALWAPVFSSAPWKTLWDSYKKSELSSEQQTILQNIPGGIPNQKFLEQFFKLKLEDEIKALKKIPLLHVEAQKDRVVNQEHGQAYHMARDGIENTRFVLLPNSDHDFSDFNDQLLAINETSQWYQSTL